MGSFQQIVMGATCLAAAFFVGSYLHNRPAENQKITDSKVVPADPIDSFLAFGQKTSNATADQRQPTFTALQPALQNPVVAQLPAAPVLAGIDPSELAPSAVQRTVEPLPPSVVSAATRKPVVPDFSELASRFRNTPLELNQPSNAGPNSNVHESERVPWSGVFNAPEMVIRQPENAQPLQNLKSAVDQVEESIRSEFASAEPNPARWRVNRSEKLDQFHAGQDHADQFRAGQFQTANQPAIRRENKAPRQDFGPRETIDDVLARRSADWLKQDEPTPETYATNPPRQGWMSEQRREVTQKAALRNRNILEVEDPGNRFQSFINEVEEISSPQPDFDNSYYTPTTQRQDSTPPPQPTARIRPIRNGIGADNWGRQSNIRQSVQSRSVDRYEGQRGDTLQSISVKFFGTPAHYIEIYKANREVLDRITSSLEGVVLEIPNVNN